MPDKKKTSSGRKRFSSNHQKSWLWGRHVVTETIKAARWPIVELYVSEAVATKDAEILQLVAAKNVKPTVVSTDRLVQLCRARDHQGFLARMGEFSYHSTTQWNQFVEQSIAQRSGLFVICDRIHDAFNFGAILRSCDGAGVTAVVIGAENQAEVTPHVARASVGAVNHLRIVRTDDLAKSLDGLQQAGVQTVAATEDSKTTCWDLSFDQPVAVVVGNEDQGIDDRLLERCSHRVRIPMLGHVASLNVAVATGILLYEIQRQHSGQRDH